MALRRLLQAAILDAGPGRSVVMSCRHSEKTLDANELIARVAGWSRRDPRVTAAGLCGSYARGDAGPDSDIDFCVIAAEPRVLLEDRTWMLDLGADARIVEGVEDYQLVQSIRVFYGPTEVEFGVADEAWMRLPVDKDTAGVINNGFRILFDPDGRLAAAAADAAKTDR